MTRPVAASSAGLIPQPGAANPAREPRRQAFEAQTSAPEARAPVPDARRPAPGARTPDPGPRRLGPGWARSINAVLAVLLAPRCAACDSLLAAPLDGPVCAQCWASILPITPPLCETCGDPLPSWRAISRERAACPRCRRSNRLVVRARAVGEYAGSLRSIVHALKYGHRTSIASRLGALMVARGGDVLDGADALVPVPLHPKRERARGFNQAALLARALPCRIRPLLVRVRETQPQVELPEARRHGNVRNAFALKSARTDCSGMVLVLIDDVSTTGATLEACARVLRGAGAREVRALTAAKAVRRQP